MSEELLGWFVPLQNGQLGTFYESIKLENRTSVALLSSGVD
jgi:hypothetical protein